jgi:hypothetical protein
MKKACFLIAIVLMVTFSCRKNDKGTVQNIFTQSSYPMAVGDWWQYQVTYYPGSYCDTLILKAISVSINGTKKDYTCHLINNGLIVDSGHFIQSDSGLSYSGSMRYSTFGEFILKFPFVTGQKWPGVFPTDTFVDVGLADSFSVSAYGPYYKPVYTLRRVFSDLHYSVIQDIFLTPNIGLVYQSIDSHSDTAPDVWESINLLKYNVQ